MGHLSDHKKQIYVALADRLNRNPVGVPMNDILMAILARLYSEAEAQVAARLPLMPTPLEKIASITSIPVEDLRVILGGMADKGLLIDLHRGDTSYYVLPPMVVGFFEYTFMRTGHDADLKDLAHLFEAYFREPEVLREFSGQPGTTLMRTLVYEAVVPLALDTEVLDYEKASHIIRESGGGAISICPCRHKAAHLGTACDAPLETCSSLGASAEWIIKHGFGRPATVDDLLKVLDLTQGLGLVHTCDNVLNKPAFICHCCGCCCTVLRPVLESGDHTMGSALPSNFVPSLDAEACTGCAICADKCPVKAISMSAESLPYVNDKACIGCGVCAAVCPAGSRIMSRRSELFVSPKTARDLSRQLARERSRR